MNEETDATIKKIQTLLEQHGLSAWLFYDFKGRDLIAHRILGLDPKRHSSRRWFYLVPSNGSPRKLVHKIESKQLDQLPGKTHVYSRWNELQEGIRQLVGSSESVAMQYSPGAAIPYISLVDGGTLDLVREIGVEVVSSENLIQYLDSVWSPDQYRQHKSAAAQITKIVQSAFRETARLIQSKGSTDEFTIQEYIMNQFADSGLETDFPPIVAVNQNSSDPHYCPTREKNAAISRDDFLLIDLWAREKVEDAVFADITWTCYLGEKIPDRVLKVFDTVLAARDRGFEIIQQRLSKGERIAGWEVDDAVRELIEKRGYGDYILHRTGHNLGQEIHGNGVNFDNFETHDTRQVIPGIACTIEPGVYTGEFGIRSEIDIFITEEGPEITTPPQRELFNAFSD